MTALRSLACFGIASSVSILLIVFPVVRAEVLPDTGPTAGIAGVQASRPEGRTVPDNATAKAAESVNLDEDTDDDGETDDDTVQLVTLRSGRHEALRKGR